MLKPRPLRTTADVGSTSNSGIAQRETRDSVRTRSFSGQSDESNVIQPFTTADVHAVFDRYDADGDGCLTVQEYQLAVVNLFGPCDSATSNTSQIKARVGSLFADDPFFSPASDNGTRRQPSSPSPVKITRALFVSRVTERAQLWNPLPTSTVSDIFSAFDRGSKGFISADDFLFAISQVAPHVKEEEARELFVATDRWGDGRIRYSDFQRLMLTRA